MYVMGGIELIFDESIDDTALSYTLISNEYYLEFDSVLLVCRVTQLFIIFCTHTDLFIINHQHYNFHLSNTWTSITSPNTKTYRIESNASITQTMPLIMFLHSTPFSLTERILPHPTLIEIKCYSRIL